MHRRKELAGGKGVPIIARGGEMEDTKLTSQWQDNNVWSYDNQSANTRRISRVNPVCRPYGGRTGVDIIIWMTFFRYSPKPWWRPSYTMRGPNFKLIGNSGILIGYLSSFRLSGVGSGPGTIRHHQVCYKVTKDHERLCKKVWAN